MRQSAISSAGSLLRGVYAIQGNRATPPNLGLEPKVPSMSGIRQQTFCVRLYGSLDLASVLQDELEKLQPTMVGAGAVRVESQSEYPGSLGNELLEGVNALVCQMNSDTGLELCLPFLKEVIDRFPFLPVLVMGRPSKKHATERAFLSKLRARGT